MTQYYGFKIVTRTAYYCGVTESEAERDSVTDKIANAIVASTPNAITLYAIGVLITDTIEQACNQIRRGEWTTLRIIACPP